MTVSRIFNGVLLETETSSCKIEFIGQDIIRVKYGFAPHLAEDCSYAVLLTTMPQRVLSDEKQQVREIELQVEENAEGVTLRAGGNTVHASASPFSICVTDRNERIVHRDIAGCAYRKDLNDRRRHCFAQDQFEHYYGFGEKSGQLDKYMRRLRMYSCDTIGYDAEHTDPLYKHIPFFIKHREKDHAWCGMFYDCTAAAFFDLGCERSGYWDKYINFTCDSGELDYYLLLGENPAQIVRAYTALTGTTAMPPLKTVGHIASTMYHTEAPSRADNEIEAFFDEMDRQDIPCDAYHLSSGYTAQKGKRCVFTWNTERFPDPAGFCRRMRNRGIILSPNVKPAMLLENPNYDRFAKAGAFVYHQATGAPNLEQYWGGAASLIDFTSDTGYAMWKQGMRESLLDTGIMAIWDDNNEYEIDHPDAMCKGCGRVCRAAELKPVFSNLMARAAREAIADKDPDCRPYILSRSGYAGIQRYAQTWAGDNGTSWNNLKYNIPIMLGMSLSGVANQGCDIGGFAGPAPDAELFVRWVQNGIFQPRFCIHSCNSDNTITQPWSFPEYTPVIRDLIRFRYGLSLYLYSLLWQAHTTGDPIMRPMMYVSPDDPCCLGESFDFCYGPFLLVASVVEQGALTRQIYLPKDWGWYDWYTGERYEGGQTITLDAPLSRVPLLYREGSIIPVVEPANRISNDMFHHVLLRIQASVDTAFTLYQDDGASNDYEKEMYLETRITVVHKEDGLLVTFAAQGKLQPITEQYTLDLDARKACPLCIEVNGETLPHYLNEHDYLSNDTGWYFHMTNWHVKIRLPKWAGSETVVRINYGIRDLIGM